MSAVTLSIAPELISGMVYGLIACVLYDLLGLALHYTRHAIERRRIQRRKWGQP